MTIPSPIRDLISAPARRTERGDLTVADRPGAASGGRAEMPEVDFLPYRLGDRDIEILGTLGELQAEYAALRRGAALFDCPQRGMVEVAGGDRLSFLNNLVTNKVDDLPVGGVRRAFLLQRTGRIIADLTLIGLEGRVLVDVDAHQAADTTKALDSFIFTEDVAVNDLSSTHHQLQVQGPLAVNVLRAITGDSPDSFPDRTARMMKIDDGDAVVWRCDALGVPGLSIVVTAERAIGTWEFLVASDQCVSEGGQRVRPAGWYAANIARVETGTPLMNIDFGTSNLPHETGVLDDRVSFTKGCYPGQEVVARMHNLGKPKQQLVGLRMQTDHLPVAGSQVFAPTEGGTAMGDPIGAVTSSSLSPMLGAMPIALAMVRTSNAEPGSAVRVNAEGEQVDAIVQQLRFVEPIGDAP